MEISINDLRVSFAHFNNPGSAVSGTNNSVKFNNNEFKTRLIIDNVKDIKIYQEMDSLPYCDVTLANFDLRILESYLINISNMPIYAEVYVQKQHPNEGNQTQENVKMSYYFKGFVYSVSLDQLQSQCKIRLVSAVEKTKSHVVDNIVYLPHDRYILGMAHYIGCRILHYPRVSWENASVLDLNYTLSKNGIYSSKKVFFCRDIPSEAAFHSCKNIIMRREETKWELLSRFASLMAYSIFVLPNVFNCVAIGPLKDVLPIYVGYINNIHDVYKVGLRTNVFPKKRYKNKNTLETSFSTTRYFYPIGTCIVFTEHSYEDEQNDGTSANKTKRTMHLQNYRHYASEQPRRVIVKAITTVNSEGILTTDYEVTGVSSISYSSYSNKNLTGSIYEAKALESTSTCVYVDFIHNGKANMLLERDAKLDSYILSNEASQYSGYAKRVKYLPTEEQYIIFPDINDSVFVSHMASNELSAIASGISIEKIFSFDSVGVVLSKDGFRHQSGTVLSELGVMVASRVDDNTGSIRCHNTDDATVITTESTGGLDLVANKNITLQAPKITILTKNIFIENGDMTEDLLVHEVRSRLAKNSDTDRWTADNNIVNNTDAGQDDGAAPPASPGANTPNVPSPGGPASLLTDL